MHLDRLISKLPTAVRAALAKQASAQLAGGTPSRRRCGCIGC